MHHSSHRRDSIIEHRDGGCIALLQNNNAGVVGGAPRGLIALICNISSIHFDQL